jgi:adenosylmethionine-8-amino-7-oxononanoate aminotransferase
VLMPPLAIASDDLRRLVGITAEAIDAATAAAALSEAA